MLLNNPPTAFPTPQTNTALRWIALTGWISIVVGNLFFFGLDLALDYADMLVPCQDVLRFGGDCNFLALSRAETTVLGTWGMTTRAYAVVMTIAPIIMLVVYWTLAGLILWRQRVSWLGLTVSLALIILPMSTVSGSRDWSSAASVLFWPALGVALSANVIMILFLYLIPNGRFSPRWAYIPLVVTILLINVLTLEINGVIPISSQVISVLYVVMVGLVLFGGSLQIYRYRRDANSVERQQTKWIILGVVSYVFSVITWVLIFGGALTIPPGTPRLLANVGGWIFITCFALLILPVAITIAILRYKLWNIDIVINRALVYGGLTLGVVAVYVLLVGGLGLLFQTRGNLVISLLATGFIAVAFNPVRERLQHGVNRLIYGQRDDPYAVLAQVSRQLQRSAVPSETLTSMVETVAATLKLPFVTVELTDQGELIGQASVGRPGTETVELPVHYQTETVGRLMVSPRAAHEEFTPQEQQLLRDIAAQIGPVAAATRLNLALQHSREQLVLAREEERRRIRRDLHDGFGPTLAAQTLKLDAVLDLLDAADVSAAAAQVKQLKRQTQQMVADIRRLVYELRPPALDELGLLEALRSHLAQTHEATSGLRISVAASPEPLPSLPAAIEVAAYRIALEGVTNAIRHAQAGACRVRFTVDDDSRPPGLVLVIADDGVGLPTAVQPGVGLTSMRERAEELGGTFEAASQPGRGTRITATLPLSIRSET